jgi:CRP/FNR family cyclic AMP-dependent transcriptional regulator
MIAIDVLKNKSVFFGLGDEQLRKIAAIAYQAAYEKGTVLFREGDRGNALFIVEAGAVDLYQKREEEGGVKLATLPVGAVMGEVTLVHIEPRSATAIAAVGETEVVILKNIDLAALFMEDRELLVVILLNITRILSKRLRVADQKLTIS